MGRRMRISCAGIFLMLGVAATAVAKLPPPSEEQAKAAEAKKAEAAAKAEKDKKELAASMEAVTKRWREKAEAKGWPIHPPTPVASTTKALDAPAKPSNPAPEPPPRSEKAGTAPPSEDVKQPESTRPIK